MKDENGWMSLCILFSLLWVNLLPVLIGISLVITKINMMDIASLEVECLARSGMAFAPDVWNQIPTLNPTIITTDFQLWPDGYQVYPHLPEVHLYKDDEGTIYSLAKTKKGLYFLFKGRVRPPLKGHIMRD